MDDQEQYLVILKSGQKYLFWAENIVHAKEQAINAEPLDEVLEVYMCVLVWDTIETWRT